MVSVKAYAAQDAQSPLAPFDFERREVGDHDVFVEIAYCGVCHSDIHQARNEWGASVYPMVPGHEIVGKIKQVGVQVKKFKVGDIVGVGCMVDSCQSCEPCHHGSEQFCDAGASFTYNSLERDGKTPTQGGYSTAMVVNQKFVLKIPASLTGDLARVAPLLCAGITTYSPLKEWKAGPGKKVGVLGLGGLGHMAIKFAHAFGAHVTLFTTSESKRADALKLGVNEVIISKDAKAMAAAVNSFDLLLDTIGSDHDLNQYLSLLKLDGALVMVGVPEKDQRINIMQVVSRRRKIAGSLIGGIQETQEMLDFCAQHHILADIEKIPMQEINQAYERMLKSDVKYRFVIDLQSLS